MDDFDYVADTGIIIADTSDVLTDVQGEYTGAFGTDLVLTNDAPQGVLITAETQARTNVLTALAQVTNQINPNEAGGIFLDALCALFGIERDAATFSMLYGCSLGGQPNINIGAGSQADDENGNTWTLLNGVQLSSSGTYTGATFIAVSTGPIACAAGELTDVGGGVLGWESVSNPAAAVPGANLQSDDSLRIQRNNTLAFQGISTNEAVESAIWNLTGVTSLFFYENFADTPLVINGVSLVPHSVYACVDGGADADIGAALLDSKTDGAAWNGNTLINIKDPYSGQVYGVSYDRPTYQPVMMQITVRRNNASSDPNAVLPQLMVDWASGALDTDEDGEPTGLAGLQINGQCSPFEAAQAVQSQYPQFKISMIQVALQSSTPDWQTTELDTTIANERFTLSLGAVTIIVIPG
jgi:uncharacterized phage protein gp47/JayE